MPAIGNVWAPGTWADTAWAANTWADASPPSDAPEIDSIVPAEGLTIGSTVCLISGANFHVDVEVTFDGISAIALEWLSATELVVTTPPHAAGAVDVVVTNPDTQFDTLVGGFLYVAPVVGSGSSAGGFARIANYVAQRGSGGYIPRSKKRRRRR